MPWAGIVHMLVNHVIEPVSGDANRATGKVYLIAVGLDGEPGKVEAQGWRFKSRLHVLAAGQNEVFRGSRPSPQPK